MKKFLAIPLLLISLNSSAQAPYVIDSINASSGLDGSTPSSMCSANGKIFFCALINGTYRQLYASDGTTPGSYMVKDINPGSGSLPNTPQLTELNGKVIFSAYNSAGNLEPYITDGTSAGTMLLKDINPGANSSNPAGYIKVGTKLFFVANNGTNGSELWATDGTTAGTYMVKDIVAGPGSSSPFGFKEFNGKLYFSISGAFWVSDGTAAGTQKVADVSSGTDYALYKGKMYFIGLTSTNGEELWCSDGTPSGTSMIKDVWTGAGNGAALTIPVVCKNTLYFVGNNGVNGNELWKTDGTAAGTSMVKDINPGYGSGIYRVGIGYLGVAYHDLAVCNDKVIFGGIDATGTELWGSDGTAAGTTMIADLSTSGYSNPTNFFVYKNRVLFLAEDNLKRYYYSTDGTTAGTFKLQPPQWPAQINGTLNYHTGYLLHSDGAVYLCAGFSFWNQDELWRIKDTTTSVSINEVAISQNNITIYPNPNDGNFILKLQNTGYTKGSIMVYDVMGKLVYMQKEIPHSATHKLYIDAPKGNYILKLRLDDAIQTKQIVIE